MIRNCAIRLLLAKKKRFDGFNLFMDIAIVGFNLSFVIQFGYSHTETPTRAGTGRQSENALQS